MRQYLWVMKQKVRREWEVEGLSMRGEKEYVMGSEAKNEASGEVMGNCSKMDINSKLN